MAASGEEAAACGASEGGNSGAEETRTLPNIGRVARCAADLAESRKQQLHSDDPLFSFGPTGLTGGVIILRRLALSGAASTCLQLQQRWQQKQQQHGSYWSNLDQVA